MIPVTFIQNEDPAAKCCYMGEKEINIVGDFREWSDAKKLDVARQALFWRSMNEPL